MRVTRRQLRKLIIEAVDLDAPGHEVSEAVNTALLRAGLSDEYRAMAMIEEENTPIALLADGKSTDPVPVEFEDDIRATDLIDKIEKKLPTSAVFGVHNPKTGVISFRKMKGG